MALPRELSELDRALVVAAARVKILSRLSWPESAIEDFLAGYRRGATRLPDMPRGAAADAGLVDVEAELRRIASQAPSADPLGRFLERTAESYADGARLLRSAGTAEFTALSRRIYGAPDDPLPGGTGTHAEVADRLIEVTAPMAAACADETEQICLTAEHVRDELIRRTEPVFGAGVIEVLVDDDLAAKAAASANRVRIRGRTCFAQADVEQLLHHEIFVHSGTALNGRAQTLQAFSLGAPRTTAAQEGLATLAELVTGSMDLSRLRRIALRIGAVRRALLGADFVEVFRYFLDHGQSEVESAHSATRVFRGGDVRGSIAFTKDVVYLRGLIGVHTFLKRAIREGKIDLIQRLFVGRLTLRDTLDLAPAIAAGDIAKPRHVPSWAADPRRLASYLALSLVWARIEIEDVSLEAILEPLE